jgi:predicted ATPase
LAGAFERATSGSGSVVALLGDAGIGKTRLLEELEQVAKGRGALVLAGRAWAMHMRLAYALLVDALGTHLRELPASDRERLVDDLPELDNLFVELPRRALAPLNDPELEKTRLFEAVSRLVERLAGSRTVVLTLDDVQWADLASIEMLHYLCRNVRRARILVALTIRIGEPETNARLNDLLHSLGGAGLLVRVEVGRLSDDEALAMTRLLLQGELSPSLESIITTRTRGVPLLVDELVRSLLASRHLRRELPWTLRRRPRSTPLQSSWHERSVTTIPCRACWRSSVTRAWPTEIPQTPSPVGARRRSSTKRAESAHAPLRSIRSLPSP